MAKNLKVTAEPKADVKTENTSVETTPTQAAPVAPIEPTRDELAAMPAKIQQELADAITKGDFIEIGKISNKLQDAIKAVNKFDAKLAGDKLAAETEQKRNASFDFVAGEFGKTRDEIQAMVDKDAADSNTPLRMALNAIFGGKVTVAKTGETGHKLASTNGGGERGGKSKEIVELLQSGGITKQTLLERYPTDGNADKLNGTARTVLSAGGWKLNDAGVYAQ